MENKITINLNKITDEEISKVFKTERLLDMYYVVLNYSFREIPNYTLVEKLSTKKMNFNVSVDHSRSSMGFIYVTDRQEKKLYEFKY